LLGLTARQIYISHIVKWAAVDGKTSKQFRQADGEPIHMLNVFVHNLNATLAQYSVKGEKANEEACLKLHAAELFAQYPFIKLLTGDAIFAARPLLRVLKELGKDYFFALRIIKQTFWSRQSRRFLG